jgi:hypothetical protein
VSRGKGFAAPGIRPRQRCDRNLATRGQKRAKPGHSSPAGAASTGPSALDRRTNAVRSSVRSHRIVRSQPSEPRRHHCRPEARVDRLRRLSAASAGRLPSLGLAGQRILMVSEAPDRSCLGRQRPRDTALGRARAPCPRAAAFCDDWSRRATASTGRARQIPTVEGTHGAHPSDRKEEEIGAVYAR